MSFKECKVPFTFCWKIINFAMCPLEIGEKLTSPEFSAEVLNNTKWYLSLYPKGANTLCGDCMSCFLVGIDNEDRSKTMSYKLEAINSNGQILASFERINEQIVKSRGRGSYKFLDRKHVEINENDTLTIRCCVYKHGFHEEQIVKCDARTEIQMESFSFKWKIQIPDIPDYSKKISALYQESTQFDVILRTSTDKIHVKVQKVAGPVRFYKLGISVFDDNGDNIKLQNNTHLFKHENNPLEYSTDIDTTKMLVESSNASSYLSFLIKCDISSPIGIIVSTIESHDFENHLGGTFLAQVRPTFLDNLRDMLFKEVHSDVKLRAGDVIIPAHKSIMSVRSPVFSAMFDQDMAENQTGIVDILEVESEILKSLLEFLYTDTFKNTDFEHVLKLILVADRYQVLSLKERCSPILMSKLAVENVIEVVYVADLISHQKLKLFAFEYIKANKSKIIPSRDWSEWAEKNSKLAIQILLNLSIN